MAQDLDAMRCILVNRTTERAVKKPEHKCVTELHVLHGGWVCMVEHLAYQEVHVCKIFAHQVCRHSGRRYDRLWLLRYSLVLMEYSM